MPINKERIKLLVDALRSGEYTQVRNVLKKDGSYCCLGVACEISGVGKWKEATEFNSAAYTVGESSNSATLPYAVADWFGWRLDNPFVKYGTSITTTLAELNDVKGLSFEQIADVLEENFLKEDISSDRANQTP